MAPQPSGTEPVVIAIDPGSDKCGIAVDESYTSEAARRRYVAENPPRGLERLLPSSLRTPSVPYDDYVAVILGERFWESLA
jgi:hypothetical protein